MVNVASQCGYTDNHYKGLVQLKEIVNDMHPGMFDILAFPSNQFGAQEPGVSHYNFDFNFFLFKTIIELLYRKLLP